MELVASLVNDRPEVARRLAERSAQADREIARAAALEFELKWLLQHARELPVVLVADDDSEFLRADIDATGDSYVLAACPRLADLMKGEIPSMGRL